MPGLSGEKQGSLMNTHKPLLDEFQVPDLDQWREEVVRLLKGAPFEKKMFTRTIEKITVGPMYTKGDISDLPWAENLPGSWPNLRGNKPGAGWLVAQELPYPTVEEFNNALRSDLRRGQTAVNLVLDKAGLRGLDPDQAEAAFVGAKGTSVASLADLEVALDGVDLEKTPLFLQAGSAALPVMALMLAMLQKHGKNPEKLSGCLGCDPVFGLAEKGTLPLELNRLYDELAVISRWAAAEAPNLKTLPVHENPWHDGGAGSALSLALVLSSAVQKLKAMEKRDILPEVTAGRIQFNLCVGTDFFMEIAKIRALRLLWSDILAAAGCPEWASSMKIHARTSSRTQTRLDPHVNMLRVTTQAMSAVLGGVDSLHVSPFDELDNLPDEFSRRIARNVQLVLAHESHFDQVQDPAGGSWYVENLTADLARQAWSIFQEIEAAGGIVDCLKSGWVQQKVAEDAELRKNRLATRKDILVGTNQYPNSQETSGDSRTLDHENLKTRRTEAMNHYRTSGGQTEHMLVLGRLEKIMEASNEELLPLLTDAAAFGATLGELTGILRHDTATDCSVDPIVLRRDAEPFEILRQRVESLGAGRNVFVACLGDFANYMPRLDFTRGFFQVGGFRILEDGFFASADSVVSAAKKFQAPVVVLTGLDTTYDEFSAETVKALKDMSPPPIIVMAGGSENHHSGLDFSISARSNILEVLGKLAEGLGVQS